MMHLEWEIILRQILLLSLSRTPNLRNKVLWMSFQGDKLNHFLRWPLPNTYHLWLIFFQFQFLCAKIHYINRQYSYLSILNTASMSFHLLKINIFSSKYCCLAYFVAKNCVTSLSMFGKSSLSRQVRVVKTVWRA